MSTKAPSRRRKGELARQEAIDAARDLLMAGGPSAVTLKAVGDRMGVGHANLIHHFGSAAGLQGALMDRMVRDLADRIGQGLAVMGPGEWGQRQLMDVAFDAFGQGGASQVAAWLALARETERAQSFAEVVCDLSDRLAVVGGGGDEARDKARAIVTMVTYMAFADGLIGDVLSDILQTPRDLGRTLALGGVMAVIAATPD